MGLEIPAPFVPATNVRENQLHHVRVNLAITHNAYGRDAHAFAVNVRSHSHRTRRRAANVRMVRAIGNEKETGGRWQSAGCRTDVIVCSCRLPSASCRLAEDAHHQRDIGKMRAARKRIV